MQHGTVFIYFLHPKNARNFLYNSIKKKRNRGTMKLKFSIRTIIFIFQRLSFT